MKNILNRSIKINFDSIGGNIAQNLTNILKKNLEGKCCKEGYIKTDTIVIINYSSGLVKGNFVDFNVLFECLICKPVSGMKIKCTVINNTKAGIRADYSKDKVSPVTIFVARDHHYKNELFSTIEINDTIQIKVIGIRYELNDPHISVLGELIKKIDNE